MMRREIKNPRQLLRFYCEMCSVLLCFNVCNCWCVLDSWVSMVSDYASYFINFKVERERPQKMRKQKKNNPQPCNIFALHLLFLSAVVSQKVRGSMLPSQLMCSTTKQLSNLSLHTLISFLEGTGDFSAPLGCLLQHRQQKLRGPEMLRALMREQCHGGWHWAERCPLGRSQK